MGWFDSEELKFNIAELESTKKKCQEVSDKLVKEKNTLFTDLAQLKNDWQTPAGKKFFDEQDTDWSQQINQYVRITNAVVDLLQAAISRYQTVLDEANRLNI